MPILRPDNKKTISQDQIKAERKIMEVLEKADSNKDGCYTKSEIKKAVKDLRSYVPGWRAMRCMVNVDANNDGQISGEEIDTLVDYLLVKGFGK
ncbi:putative EF-hand domain pair protein [Medicago truncatula]|uniref:EF hand protein n=1 Tax=Medicago truncatula TaxID=3880 RepID=G7I3M7_MEDTR|nr:EF hand protein [Medicago truncatula]RHN77327.1 putative EF-hand domain pair protein [Medicago truncatula]